MRSLRPSVRGHSEVLGRTDSRLPVVRQGPVEKLLSSPAIQFKGTGWYITDYARKGQGGTPASSSTNTPKTESGDTSAKPAADSGGAAKTETKSDTKSAESSSNKE